MNPQAFFELFAAAYAEAHRDYDRVSNLSFAPLYGISTHPVTFEFDGVTVDVGVESRSDDLWNRLLAAKASGTTRIGT